MTTRGISETVVATGPAFYSSNSGAALVLTLDASISQQHEVSCEVTQHPVEEGIAISDHVRRNPITLTINGVISAYPVGVESPPPNREIEGWALLEGMVGQVFDVATSLRRYPKMALKRASVARESRGGSEILPALELLEIRTVKVQTGSIPPEIIKKPPQKANGPKEQNLGKQPTDAPTAAQSSAANRSLAARLLDAVL